MLAVIVLTGAGGAANLAYAAFLAKRGGGLLAVIHLYAGSVCLLIGGIVALFWDR